MKEFFYEESAVIQDEKSAKIKYYTFKIMSILSYVIMSLWIILVIYGYEFSSNIILDIVIVLIPFAMFLTSGILLGKFKNRFYIDYDYTLVTGSLRFSKVIKNYKRKFLISFEASQIEKLGEYGSSICDKYLSMPNVTKLILTSNTTPSEEKNFYYLVVNTDGDKKLLVLECTEKFIAYTMQFANKLILDEEFVKKLNAKRK